jgi:hypothetical protein
MDNFWFARAFGYHGDALWVRDLACLATCAVDDGGGPMTRSPRAIVCAAVTTTLTTLVLTSPAGAATVQLTNQGPDEHSTVDSYVLGFRAAPGESNVVSISAVPSGVLIRDTGAPLAAGPYCQQAVDGVTCAPGLGGALGPSAVIDLGDGDDRLTVADLRVDVQDGPGDDVIEMPGGTFHAGTGADVMRITNPAAATEVTYATRTAGVSITEDGVADDGEAGEHDDVGDGIPSVTGGSGDDVLVAGQEPHILDGGPGGDRLVGGPRDDILIGDDPLTGAGDDVLLGGDGDDQLLAWAGADVIRGGPGKDATLWPHAIAGVHVTLDDRPGDGVPGENDDVGSDVEVLEGTKYDDVMVGSDGPQSLDGREDDDRLDGAGGPDQIFGGAGDHNVLTGGAGVDSNVTAGARDTIRTRDGARDSVGCGTPSSSRQRFDVDAFDGVRSCATQLRLRDGQRRRLDRRGRVAFVARCPARRGTCAGSVRLARCRAFKVTIGRGGFRVPEGQTRRVRVRLTHSARRYVARHHLVCVYATARTRRTRPPPSAAEATVRLALVA